jgi:RimJ/RimL family protein N-acetyltransferase
VAPLIVLPPILEDGVIRLDAHTPADADAHRQGEDAEMRRRFEAPRPATLEEIRVAIGRWSQQRACGGPGFTYALRMLSGELAGGCELRRPDADCAHVSYWVFAAFRRQGLAGRALRLMLAAAREAMPELRAFEAHIDPDNVASRALAAGAGFVESGQVEEAALSGETISRLRYVLAAPGSAEASGYL